ncbi:hypothetical protein PHMEG_00022058 [Phytophthora megakarya]|uniref:CUE domain-containing protein n=1 Tax=Phytophthora megakarya TaxID=4795 RepID=A0A225VMM8_9STRA|nr:hypothetical protein PHMEG_00022058 [Phytophthora megakarya]
MSLSALSDAELPTLLSDDGQLHALLPLLDDFFTRGTALQTRPDVAVARSLTADSRAVFSLFLRLVDAPQLVQLATDCGLLHMTRLAPFCQIFGVRNADAVAELLHVLVLNVAAFPTSLHQLRQLYIQQLNTLHAIKRGQVTDRIQQCYELSLSLSGMTTSKAVTEVLLLQGKDIETELALQDQSLLYGLVRCYEEVLPALQRHLSTFEEGVVMHETSLIAETRHTLLKVLGRKQGRGKLLAGLHALSNGSMEHTAEHGSYLSDLWFLCEFKDKVAEFFDRCKLDLENFSYLNMVIEELPRRRILPTILVKDLAAETKPKTLSIDAEEWKAQPESTVVDNEKPENNGTEAEVMTVMVNQVKEFFPDLGDGYVELCLVSSNLQVEVVINFLLESNPPPALLDVSQDLKRSDPEFLQVEALITGKPVHVPQTKETKKLDPSRVWVGKKTMEKTYNPQIGKDQAEKMKHLIAMYEEEDEYGMASGEGSYSGMDSRYDGVTALDEYDDDYNDEFDDFVPFSIRDGVSADDQDTIREENRRIRAKEEKDAFWENMKNRNRENPLNVADDDEDADQEEKEDGDSSAPKFSRPNSAGGSPQIFSGSKHKSTRRKDKRQGDNKPDEPLTPQQIQRQRARKDKNKAKVANHNRKDRAMKKMG